MSWRTASATADPDDAWRPRGHTFCKQQIAKGCVALVPRLSKLGAECGHGLANAKGETGVSTIPSNGTTRRRRAAA